MGHYTDSQAKAVLRNTKYWPTRTRRWGVASNTEYWIRCRPGDTAKARNPLPRLSLPGACLFTTQPDGMWVYFRGTTCADVLAIEVCNSMQNLNDKRSRFLSTGSGLMLAVPTSWFSLGTRVQHGANLTRAAASGCFAGTTLPPGREVNIPVRFLRALFVIPDAKYSDWMANHVPAGHEFFMKQNSLKSATAQPTQRFLGGMSFQSHFCTRR